MKSASRIVADEQVPPRRGAGSYCPGDLLLTGRFLSNLLRLSYQHHHDSEKPGGHDGRSEVW